jgi:hypothetical protein
MNVDAGPSAVKGIMTVLHDLNESQIEQINQTKGLWAELCNRACWTQKQREQLEGMSKQRYLTQDEQARFGWPFDPHVGKIIQLETRGADDKDFTYHNWSVYRSPQQGG